MRRLYLPAITLAILSALFAAHAGVQRQKAAAVRGDYLVNRVAMCIDCHTATLPTGEKDKTRQLAGAPIAFKPEVEVPNWASAAPNLTPEGFLKAWPDEQLVKFLMTGITPTLGMADPPMPQYRLNRADAGAVTSYLRSLPPVESRPPKPE